MVKFLVVLLYCFNLFARTDEDNLSLEQAQKRKQQVRSVNYEMQIELQEHTEEFKAKTFIHAELLSLKDDLTIDANLRNILSVRVNGKLLSNFTKRKGSFDIPKSVLAKKIDIEVEYSSIASPDARGFKKFQDPVDKEEYFFSDFEPYYAHWLFPCFDQPDLKGTFEITVKSPDKWKVISNELPIAEKKEGEYKFVRFKRTPILSPYVIFLGAGPFAEWTDKLGEIPLSLYSRKSFAKFMDPENLFASIKKGITFFANYFDYPYPYSKYSQIFIPDLPTNAVESAGAVTFSETFIFISPVSQLRREGRDNIIFHEIAHMWFGNLVTMKWWSDLWLKEGFAVYSASMAQTAMGSSFGEIDALNSKSWAYWQDTLLSSHPIKSEITDVKSSRGIFDGITYAKSSAAIKQLNFYVGEESFKKGIQAYFKKYAFKNAGLDDFVESVAVASGKDLKNWSHSWLETYGPNKVKFDFQCQKNKITEASILQDKNSSGVLSPHRTLLGFYKPGKDQFQLVSQLDVTYETEKKYIEELNHKDCPQFVLPNYTDKDYALFGFDKNSLRLASQALVKLPDPLSRYQVWIILMQMVKQKELSPMQFMDMAKEAFKFEKDDSLLGMVLTRTTQIKDFRQIYGVFLTEKQRAVVSQDFEKIFIQRMQSAKASSQLQNLFFEFYITFAQSKEAQARIYDYALGKNLPDGIQLDPERKWRLYKALAQNGHPEALNLIAAEKQRDKSMLSKILGIGAEASFPDQQIKQDIVNKLFNPGELSYHVAFVAAQSLFPANQNAINEKFVDNFFSKVTSMDWKVNDELVTVFFFMFPDMICTKEVEMKSEKFLKSATNLTANVRKAWMEHHGELSTCVQIRAKFK